MKPEKPFHYPPPQYNDYAFRVIIALLAAHLLIVYGEHKSTFEMLLIPGYYKSLLGSFLIAWALVEYVGWVTRKLDKSYDWRAHVFQRSALQTALALGLPSLLAFLMAFAYFQTRGLDILNTTYLRLDFPFIVLLLVLLNAYYVAFYCYLKWTHAEHTMMKVLASVSEPENKNKDIFMVSKGANVIPLPTTQISYVYRDEEVNYLKTVDAETYYLSQSLDEIQQQLSEDTFFRANRQIIVHRQAIKNYGLLDYGKLEADLLPTYKEKVIISQKKALAFKKWLDS